MNLISGWICNSESEAVWLFHKCSIILLKGWHKSRVLSWIRNAFIAVNHLIFMSVLFQLFPLKDKNPKSKPWMNSMITEYSRFHSKPAAKAFTCEKNKNEKSRNKDIMINRKKEIFRSSTLLLSGICLPWTSSFVLMLFRMLQRRSQPTSTICRQSSDVCSW